MLAAYKDMEEGAMVASRKKLNIDLDDSGLLASEKQVGRLQAMVDGAQSALMTIDRDLIVTYVNNAAKKLLARHAVGLKQLYPDFPTDRLVGSCIDILLKNSIDQRGIFNDASNLPFDSDIDVGPLKFHLHVTAIQDTHGEYVGSTLEWADITEKSALAKLNADYQGKIEAINKSQAVIEFNMDGTILTANDNFLNTLGYTLMEIEGKHHSMFAEAGYANSAEYKAFWERLNRGEYDTGEYKRIGKDGKEVWIQASYNPIADLNGKPFKVVKYATDVTDVKLKSANFGGQIEAISKSQAVIEFNMDGTILAANDNFLNTLGYTFSEIEGKHHSMFAEASYANSAEYKAFWEKLNRGEYDTGEYKRIGKGGKEVWIQASYNPITDLNGKAFKVVKYATDITEQKHALNQIQNLVNGAVKGELDQRINTEQYEGFVRDLGEGINVLMDSVVAPVQEVGRVMKALAAGDVAQSMDGEFRGEFAGLRDSVNSTMGNLLDVVVKIRESSNSISSAANEIAQGNQDLSQRTEQQATSLQETASSMEELTSTVKQNADNAVQADQLAVGAREQAEKGGSVVSDAVSAMNEINSASKKIADIIGVIDEIAFQTNLLALNAAVEAARAGEQGRGFAVVASEVRNLAQRSASAAKEIKTLINDSVEKVDEGSKLVNKSGATLEEIVIAVKKVGDIIAEIAAASKEQSSGIDQINIAVAQMDEVTQQNAALVEEAAAASESVNDQANGLDELIGFFNTGDEVVNTSQPARRVAPQRRVVQSVAARAPARKRAPSTVTNEGDGEWDEF